MKQLSTMQLKVIECSPSEIEDKVTPLLNEGYEYRESIVIPIMSRVHVVLTKVSFKAPVYDAEPKPSLEQMEMKKTVKKKAAKK